MVIAFVTLYPVWAVFWILFDIAVLIAFIFIGIASFKVRITSS